MKTSKYMLCRGGLGGLVFLAFLPDNAWSTASAVEIQDYTQHWGSMVALLIFILAYALVIAEEALHLRKSKPVLVAAGIIWGLVALVYSAKGDTSNIGTLVEHNLLEYAKLFLFLLAAMAYINTMDERGVFDALRVWLVTRNFSLRTIFWLTGLLAFLISPLADNLTTALLMTSVVIAVGKGKTHFVKVSCINVVVAANAGGAFSPFGDITTLMVWQKGLVRFEQFISLFLPSLVNWLVPALILSLTIPKGVPEAVEKETHLKQGAWFVVALFGLTISMAVSAHNFLHLPPVLGMMTGLGLLTLFGYYLKLQTGVSHAVYFKTTPLHLQVTSTDPREGKISEPFNIFRSIERAEWDTLMFFYGIILCVGGLNALGFLNKVSQALYVYMGPTMANIFVGMLSAIIDNIPVMFAVLTMEPDMNIKQWLLVTLTVGVGGSLLSIGSAAGVAVMGKARHSYTFFGHLKWTWAIALGYAASIWMHLRLN